MARSKRTAHPEIGGIAHLEHVNFEVADHDMVSIFFMAGLGFTRDPYTRTDEKNMAANVGQQQFHLPRLGRPTPPMHGVIGLITPELDAVKERCDVLEKEGVFKDTPYAYEVKNDCHEVMSPFGVKMRLHATGSMPFPRVLGLPYVDIPVPPGSAAGILKFYERVMRAPCYIEEMDGKTTGFVTMGPYQWTRFIETEGLDSYDNDTFHIAYYVSNYNEVLDFIDDGGAVIAGGQNQIFFFQKIFDPDTGDEIFSLQNEVRSFYHEDFMRPLINRWPMGDEPFTSQRDPNREQKRQWGVMPGPWSN
ncbi:MAG: hypothetical protein O2912_08480 [Proteobacteria bacterium]|nr:hypothetical protein [Pseudomonadota bacterium]